MNEIALIGTNGRVMSSVLSRILENGFSVNVLTPFPTRIMIDNTNLTVSRLDVMSEDATREALEGYSTLVIANETDLQNDENDSMILKYFDKTVRAASEAGAKRVIVVGAKESNAFYVSHLKRHDDIDWVYFDTEGDFADAVVKEIVSPAYHRENASF